MKIEKLDVLGMIYIGSPYSKYPGGPACAYADIAELVAEMVKRGMRNMFSPICHCHPMTVYGIDPLDAELWMDVDRIMMVKADALVVAMMDTWKKSAGLKAEIKEFTRAGKPVYYLDPDTLDISTQPS